jgi:hypothetical protein
MTSGPGAGEQAVSVRSSEMTEIQARKQAKRRMRIRRAALVCGSVLSVESLGLGGLALTGGHCPLWLLLLAPVLLLGVCTLFMGMDSKRGEDRRWFWPGTILTLGAGATTALTVSHTISGWYSALAISLAFIGFGFFVPEALPQAENEDAEAEPEVRDAIPGEPEDARPDPRRP